MNVAIVLTGHMRCWDQVAPNFNERILERYKPDVFIHTWRDEAWWDPHSKAGFVEGTPEIDFQGVADAFKATAMAVEDFEDLRLNFEERASEYPNFYHVPKNIISMLYKMGQGALMLEDFMLKSGKTYDLVMRLRPDMVYNQDLPDFDPSKFYTLAHRNHMGGGTGDMMQIGNPFFVTNFCKILNYLPFIYKDTDLLCPHVISTTWIEKLALPWQEFMIDKKIMHTPKGEYVPKQAYMNQ
jgi:hypothetical protein